MSLDEFIVELGSSVKFKTRLDDLLSESCNFRLQPSTLRFSVGDSLLHIAFFPLIFDTVLGLLGQTFGNRAELLLDDIFLLLIVP